MRILLVTGSYPPMPCGMGDYTACLARALARVPGMEIAVLTSRAAAETNPAIRLFACMDGWRLRDLPLVDRVIAKFRPDVVHVQYPTFGYGGSGAPLLIPLLAARRGARAVRTFHEPAGRRYAPSLLLQAAARGGYIIVRPDFVDRMHAWLRPFTRARSHELIEGASAIPASVSTDAQIAALRAHHLGGAERLIAFFGFVYADKGTDLVFEIADPARDRLLIIGKVVDHCYTREIAATAERDPWHGRVTYTGFLPAEETAALLKAADAVVLPFRDGGGSWNSSVSAAVKQGTPVVTTSRDRVGFDAERMIDRSRPGDVAAMRAALDRLAGRRRAFSPEVDGDDWQRIAERHVAFYRACLA